MGKVLALASFLVVGAIVALLCIERAPARSRARGPETADPPIVASSGQTTSAPPDAAPKAVLSGRVLDDATDLPVSGAAVTVRAVPAGEILRATSAADGTFGFPDAAADSAFQLVARHEGLAATSLRVASLNDPVVVRLVGGGGVRGRVITDEGAGVPACQVLAVRIEGEDGTWSVYEWLMQKALPEEMAIAAGATTRLDGRFEMEHLAPSTYLLLTLAEGLPLQAGRRVRVTAGVTAEVEIREPGTAPSLVDVIDQGTGEPLDGARFEILGQDISSPLPAQYLGDGVYELRQGFRRGNFLGMSVRVRRNGYAPRVLLCGGGWRGYHRRAALGRGATIAGHVRAATGPLARALVFVVVSGNMLAATAVTGDDGGFEIPGLDAPEGVDVFVLSRSLDPVAELGFQLREGERRVLEIGGSEGAAIEGRIVLGGVPAAGAWIRLWGPCVSRTYAGSDGTYAFEGLDADRYTVSFNADGVEYTRGVEIGKAQRARLDVEAPCSLSGTVVDAATRAPVTTAKEIVARRVDVPTEEDTTATVGDDGSFRLHVEPGVYEVDCRDNPKVHVVERPRVDLTRRTESGPVALRVEPDPQDGRIVLDVKDARTGDVVSKGRWGSGPVAWLDDKRFAGAHIEVKELSLGSHRLTVWSDEHAPTAVEITLTPERKDVRQTVLLQPSEAVRVGYIQRGAPEAIAGLREDDVILSFTSVVALRSALASARGAVAIEIERAGERKTLALPAGAIDADLQNILLGR